MMVGWWIGVCCWCCYGMWPHTVGSNRACFLFIICGKWDEWCDNFNVLGNVENRCIRQCCLSYGSHKRFLDLLHKETYFHAKLTCTGLQYLQMTHFGCLINFLFEVYDYSAELQRCIHLKDDPEIYSRAVSSHWIACGTQDNCDPFLNGLLSSPWVSGDAPLLKCCCCVLQHGDDWYALTQNSARWWMWSGMVVDGIDTVSGLNERLLCVCELEIHTCSIYCRVLLCTLLHWMIKCLSEKENGVNWVSQWDPLNGSIAVDVHGKTTAKHGALI